MLKFDILVGAIAGATKKVAADKLKEERKGDKQKRSRVTCLLPCGCVKEEAASLGERHDVAVRLNVGTCAVGETDGTPTGEESAIHSLRVYALSLIHI